MEALIGWDLIKEVIECQRCGRTAECPQATVQCEYCKKVMCLECYAKHLEWKRPQ